VPDRICNRVVVAAGAGLGVAHTETRNWVGAIDALWSTPGNWSPSGAPQDGDALIFAVAGTSDNNLPAGLQVQWLTFSPVHTVTGNAFTLAAGMQVLGPGSTTLNVSVTLGGDQTWAPGDHLGVNAPIDLNNHTLSMGGMDAVHFPPTVVFLTSTAPILGPGDLTLFDLSTLVLGSTLNSFGRAHFNGTGSGVLAMGIAHALSSTGGVDLAPAARLQLSGYDTTLKWLGGTGAITNALAPPANLTIDLAADLTFSGTILSITDLIKVGAGELVLAGSNGYGGLTDVRAGTLRITNPNALGSTSGATKVSGSARLVP
jgi:fibronectin-binding autotransporter adhesin